MSVNYSQSPLDEAQTAGRSERQALIVEYERRFGCRLVVMIGEILEYSITLFEDLIYDADPTEDLHLMLASPSGDGETAVRLARSMQERCRELEVIVPTQAKSAAILLALGAHRIVMAPFSDLGPVDPQMWDGENFVAAKDVIAAVDDAVQKVTDEPATAPIYDRLLADLTASALQEARAALESSYILLGRALLSNPDRTMGKGRLYEILKERLIDSPQTHTDLFSIGDAESATWESAALQVIRADLRSEKWTMLWRLWTMYFTLGPGISIYEGRSVSHVLGRGSE